MFMKLRTIKAPDIENVQALWRESITSQGMTESIDATDAPSPINTSNDGRAQHNNVLRDVNSDK
jgi:hypothetical protein